jgi:hypothetical protein
MNLKSPWVWVVSGTVAAVFALLALLPLLAVSGEMAREAELTSSENAAIIAFLTVVVGAVAGGVTLLVSAGIAHRRSRTRAR